MAKNLVIVESPAKAKTIGKILGRNYSVQASYGHVRDLPKSKLGVDVEHDFAPSYVIPPKSRKVITDLKKAAAGAELLYLATDEDREGEAIAWHLLQAMKADPTRVRRVAFHEITEPAVKEAFEHPRDLDTNLIDAQQARRILDRLVGYKLSPLLWKKICRGLSAGRVQSAALRLLVEREREVQAFKPEEYWEIDLQWETLKKGSFATKVAADPKLITQLDADKVVLKVKAAPRHLVASAEKAQRKRYPSPPFTTSTLQQQAGTALGFTVKKTMMIAQQLYEGVPIDGKGPVGLITYMRTDSTNLSPIAVDKTREVIAQKFGANYLPDQPIFYKTKSKGAQEAHEAIRPSDSALLPERLAGALTPDQLKLYKLIWQRMLACQMLPAILDTQEITVDSDGVISRANGAAMAFAGFAAVFDRWPFKEIKLPELAAGDELKLLDIASSQHFTEPPARYTEASLVKQLEEMGIGRPSTYVPTITTLTVRNYAKKDKKALVPQEIGMLVSDFLVEHFPQIVDYDFTAKMEKDLDDIAEGEQAWVPIIRDFYRPFAEQLAVKESVLTKQTPPDETTDRLCVRCSSPMVIRTGRFGRFLACSTFPKCRYTEPLNGDGQSEVEKTDKTCPECSGALVNKRGKFGMFLGCSNYPDCKYIENSAAEQVDMACPKCQDGKVVVRRTKRGRTFYGCSRYPKCDFASWDKPLATPCPTCGKLMVESAKKGHPVCTECGFEEKSA
ncbi:MAG: type I DNA topoisomerase [bacterium]